MISILDCLEVANNAPNAAKRSSRTSWWCEDGNIYSTLVASAVTSVKLIWSRDPLSAWSVRSSFVNNIINKDRLNSTTTTSHSHRRSSSRQLKVTWDIIKNLLAVRFIHSTITFITTTSITANWWLTKRRPICWSNRWLILINSTITKVLQLPSLQRLHWRTNGCAPSGECNRASNLHSLTCRSVWWTKEKTIRSCRSTVPD